MILNVSMNDSEGAALWPLRKFCRFEKHGIIKFGGRCGKKTPTHMTCGHLELSWLLQHWLRTVLSAWSPAALSEQEGGGAGEDCGAEC